MTSKTRKSGRKLIRYTAVKTEKGMALWRCTLKQLANDVVYITYPDAGGTSVILSSGPKAMEEKSLNKDGLFKTPIEALTYMERQIKSHIRRLQKWRARTNAERVEIRDLIKLEMSK